MPCLKLEANLDRLDHQISGVSVVRNMLQCLLVGACCCFTQQMCFLADFESTEETRSILGRQTGNKGLQHVMPRLIKLQVVLPTPVTHGHKNWHTAPTTARQAWKRQHSAAAPALVKCLADFHNLFPKVTSPATFLSVSQKRPDCKRTLKFCRCSGQPPKREPYKLN